MVWIGIYHTSKDNMNTWVLRTHCIRGTKVMAKASNLVRLLLIYYSHDSNLTVNIPLQIFSQHLSLLTTVYLELDNCYGENKSILLWICCPSCSSKNLNNDLKHVYQATKQFYFSQYLKVTCAAKQSQDTSCFLTVLNWALQIQQADASLLKC